MNSELGKLWFLGVGCEELHFLLFDLQSAVCVQQGFLKSVFNKWLPELKYEPGQRSAAQVAAWNATSGAWYRNEGGTSCHPAQHPNIYFSTHSSLPWSFC